MNNQETNRKNKYTVSFTTLGCKVNQFETEAMTELLEKEGFVVLPSGEQSDIYIINTCAVTKESERKSR
ncbi:MAG: modification enzyme MiaB family, partial [Sedimentibacter sp.]|nr:modification enzyme MiaB family [Sedimentibacter sp.]